MHAHAYNVMGASLNSISARAGILTLRDSRNADPHDSLHPRASTVSLEMSPPHISELVADDVPSAASRQQIPVHRARVGPRREQAARTARTAPVLPAEAESSVDSDRKGRPRQGAKGKACVFRVVSVFCFVSQKSFEN